VTFRKHQIISGKVDDVHRASVVPFERMLEIGDPVPPRRNTYIAHVATDLAEHMTDGIFEPVLAPGLSNDGELRSVRRPVGLPYCLLDFSWRAAVERHSRQRAGEETEPDVLCA